jgi:hypothetical protein
MPRFSLCERACVSERSSREQIPQANFGARPDRVKRHAERAYRRPDHSQGCIRNGDFTMLNSDLVAMSLVAGAQLQLRARVSPRRGRDSRGIRCRPHASQSAAARSTAARPAPGGVHPESCPHCSACNTSVCICCDRRFIRSHRAPLPETSTTQHECSCPEAIS